MKNKDETVDIYTLFVKRKGEGKLSHLVQLR